MSNLIGKSWDDFSLADPDYKEDDEDEVLSMTTDVKPDDQSTPRNSDQLCKIPESLAYLFGRYPMADHFSVTTCNYCERVLSSTHFEKHVEECEKIPQVVKDELHMLTYGTKPKSGSHARKTSTGSSTDVKTPRLPITATITRPPKQSSPPAELQSTKSSHSVSLTSRTCSSAPSSPTGSSSNTQPLATVIVPLTTNYSFPTIKIEKSDSPGPVDEKPKPTSSATATTSLKPKKTLLIPPPTPPPTIKIKPSVVLKIKGNTSTTTTSAGRITLHAAPTEPPCPSPPVVEDVNQNVCSPKPASTVAVVNIPQQSRRGLDEAFLPSVVASLGITQPKVSIKLLDINEASPLPKKKRLRHDARKIIPLRERSFNPNEHCGVIGTDGIQCKRSLTCKTHSMGLRRAVPGRSHPFDILISTQKQARDKAKLARPDTSSPLSPIIGLSPLVDCSISSGDGSSDASRLSIPAPTPPSVTSTTTTNIKIRPSPAPAPTMTLQSLLNSGIQFGEGTAPPFTPFLHSEHKTTTISVVSPKVMTAAPPPSQLLKKKLKKPRESGEAGIKLQLVTKEPEGFDCVTHIIPPDEEPKAAAEDSTLFDTLPFVNGNNILLLEESGRNILYEPVPMIPIPLGRRKKGKWRRSGSAPNIIFRQVVEENPPNKKPRIEKESLADMMLLGDWMQEPLSETLTLTRGDDAESADGVPPPTQSNVSASSRSQPPPTKVSFRIHAKKLCRPHHGGRSRGSQDITVRVGPLVEMTQVLNGLSVSIVDFAGANQPLASFGPMEISDDGKGGEQAGHLVSQQHPQLGSKSYEENGRNWMVVEPNRSVDAHAPVADSELSKLLAAQFEDY